MPDQCPVVLFTYARPEHTLKTLEALSCNKGAAKYQLLVFSDAAKNETDLAGVNEVREILHKFNWPGAKSIKLRPQNHGLMNNVMTGLDEVFAQFPSAIVLEDDLITSGSFLNYCHTGLHQYQSNENVWSINGYQFDLGIEDGTPFLSRLGTSSWGWATWADRWHQFRAEFNETLHFQDKDLISRMNFGGFNFSEMIRNPNSWAIRWYAFVQSRKGLGLFPRVSLVQNIGFDGSGVHAHAFTTSGISYRMPEMMLQKEANLRLERKQQLALNPSEAQSFLQRLRSKIGV